MLATLGADPVAFHPGPVLDVSVDMRWLSAPPEGDSPGDRVQIALGVWTIRYRHWSTPGGVDTAADLPDLPDADPPAPRSRYSQASWHGRALCRKLPLDLSEPLFFGTEDRQAPEDLIVAVETARRVCAVCPVEQECLTYALEHDMRYGVWGGTSGKQREKMRLQIATGVRITDLVDRWLG